MNDIKIKFQDIKEKIFSSKLNVAFLLGLVGIILIFISGVFGDSSSKKQEDKFTDIEELSEKYVNSIENKLESIISDMLGGTKVQVLVTLDSSAEYIYASETKTDVGVSEDKESQRNEQNDSNEKSYVLMKDADGNEAALVVCKMMPEIRGVVIVCESGQTDAVAAAVRLAVKSALNIDENKICIIGRHG